MHKLDVFDFDGTLFRTPLNTHENRQKYEKATGVPWLIDKKLAAKLTQKLGHHVGMRRGWWGRKETLEPPLVPDPTPPEFLIEKTCEEFLRSKANPESITLMMTGRYLGLQHHVLRILGDANIVDVERNGDRCQCVDPNVVCMFLGADGPRMLSAESKPSETLPWKIWILDQYFTLYDIEAMEIWEDRPEHVEAFRGLDWGIKITVHHVKDCEGA